MATRRSLCVAALLSAAAVVSFTSHSVTRAEQQGRSGGRGGGLALGQPGPNLPAGQAPDQGYVPAAWTPHMGGLLKYRVQIRFGEEPDTMPDGFKFGRVSAVTTDAANNVYVFQRGPKADPIVVFDATG
jgi:hypothetical protein